MSARACRCGLLVLAFASLLPVPAAGGNGKEQAERDQLRTELATKEYRLGRTAFLARRYNKAIAHYRRANAIKYSPTLHYNIGLAQAGRGDKPKACASFLRFLREKPKASQAAKARTRMRRLCPHQKVPRAIPPKKPKAKATPPPEARKKARASGKRGYSVKAIAAAGRNLARSINMPERKRIAVMGRVRNIARRRRKRGDTVRAVFAYLIKQGGFIVKFTKGHGRVSFNNGPRRMGLALKSTSIGAQIGGSKAWGIGLVFNLTEPRHFGGSYRGNTRGIVGLDSGFSITELRRVDGRGAVAQHTVTMVGAAKGLEASAGGASMTITVAR